jgi:hypothetical protein
MIMMAIYMMLWALLGAWVLQLTVAAGATIYLTLRNRHARAPLPQREHG